MVSNSLDLPILLLSRYFLRTSQRGPEGQPGGGGEGRRYGRTYGGTKGKSPNSPGLRPLSGPLPKKGLVIKKNM